MSSESLKVWVLAAMTTAWLHLGPIVGIRPVEIAQAIAVASFEKPVFAGSDGALKTAALLTALGVYESGYRQIEGDCKDKPPGWPGCGKLERDTARPTSFCFLQVHFPEGVEKVKGYTPEELMRDPLACARAGREIARDSVKGNKDEPLKSYAGTSGPAARRWELALKLYRDVKAAAQ